MPVSGLQILLLEECRRRENNIGIIGCVSKELLMNHREQVRPLQTAYHLVVIRAHGCGIGVVDKERLDGRLVETVERLP